MKTIIGALLASTLLAVSPASAAVLVDGLPTGTLAQSGYTNMAAGQNFLVRFSLAAASDITGFEILEGSAYPVVGTALRIKIRADIGGNPASTNSFSFVDQVDALSNFETGVVKVTTNFAPITLAAGSYWFGVSGENTVQTWAAYNNGKATSQLMQRQLAGDTIVGTPGIQELAFTVLGNTSAVPEPASWAMMIVGLGAVGGVMRRRKVTTTVRFA